MSSPINLKVCLRCPLLMKMKMQNLVTAIQRYHWSLSTEPFIFCPRQGWGKVSKKKKKEDRWKKKRKENENSHPLLILMDKGHAYFPPAIPSLFHLLCTPSPSFSTHSLLVFFKLGQCMQWNDNQNVIFSNTFQQWSDDRQSKPDRVKYFACALQKQKKK